MKASKYFKQAQKERKELTQSKEIPQSHIPELMEEYAKLKVEEAKQSIRQMLIDDDKEFLAERI